MRFGLFFQAPESPGRTPAERFDEMLELIRDLVNLTDSLVDERSRNLSRDQENR